MVSTVGLVLSRAVAPASSKSIQYLELVLRHELASARGHVQPAVVVYLVCEVLGSNRLQAAACKLASAALSLGSLRQPAQCGIKATNTTVTEQRLDNSMLDARQLL